MLGGSSSLYDKVGTVVNVCVWRVCRGLVMRESHPLSHTLIRPLLGLVAWFSTREMTILRPVERPRMLARSELSISSARAYGKGARPWIMYIWHSSRHIVLPLMLYTVQRARAQNKVKFIQEIRVQVLDSSEER